MIDGVGGRHVEFCAGGKHLLIWGGDSDLFAYDVATRARLWQLTNCQAMAVSLDGEIVASLEMPKANVLANRLVLRASATGKPLHPKPWQGAADLSLVTYTDGNQVVVATSDGALHVLDGATQQEVANPASVANLRCLGALGTKPALWAHVQAYDAGTMALRGPSAIQRINSASGQVTATWAGASQALSSADGRLLALLFLGKKPVVRVVSLETEAVKYVLAVRGTKPGNDPMYGWHLAFSPDGAQLAISERTYDTTTKREASVVSVYDMKQGLLLGSVELGPNPKRPDRPDLTIDARGLALSVDGILCVATDTHGLRFWRV